MVFEHSISWFTRSWLISSTGIRTVNLLCFCFHSDSQGWFDLIHFRFDLSLCQELGMGIPLISQFSSILIQFVSNRICFEARNYCWVSTQISRIVSFQIHKVHKIDSLQFWFDLIQKVHKFDSNQCWFILSQWQKPLNNLFSCDDVSMVKQEVDMECQCNLTNFYVTQNTLLFHNKSTATL